MGLEPAQRFQLARNDPGPFGGPHPATTDASAGLRVGIGIGFCLLGFREILQPALQREVFQAGQRLLLRAETLRIEAHQPGRAWPILALRRRC